MMGINIWVLAHYVAPGGDQLEDDVFGDTPIWEREPYILVNQVMADVRESIADGWIDGNIDLAYVFRECDRYGGYDEQLPTARMYFDGDWVVDPYMGICPDDMVRGSFGDCLDWLDGSGYSWLVEVYRGDSLIDGTVSEWRVCSECGGLMCEGFCVGGGSEYYCDEECLHKHYTAEEWEQMYEEDDDDNYYTTWY